MFYGASGANEPMLLQKVLFFVCITSEDSNDDVSAKYRHLTLYIVLWLELQIAMKIEYSILLSCRWAGSGKLG